MTKLQLMLCLTPLGNNMAIDSEQTDVQQYVHLRRGICANQELPVEDEASQFLVWLTAELEALKRLV